MTSSPPINSPIARKARISVEPPLLRNVPDPEPSDELESVREVSVADWVAVPAARDIVAVYVELSLAVVVKCREGNVLAGKLS